MPHITHPYPAELAELAAALRPAIAGDVHCDVYSRVLYSTDASNYQIEPLGVVIPRTADDIAATVTLCANRGIPVLARGAGTSLAGQAVGRALILDCSRYLDQIVALDTAARTVRVQPGVILGTLNDYLHPHGLMLGPDPASAERATIGGALANNATGAHSIRYGMFADQVLAATSVLADGQVARFASFSDDDPRWSAGAHGASRTAAIYRGLRDLRTTYEADIRQHFPRYWRRASGYGLTYLLADGPGRHPGDVPRPVGIPPLLAGSEGTLAIVTEVTLALVTRPRHTALAVLQFTDLVAAMEATHEILACAPAAVEVMDELLITLARQQPAAARRMGFIEGTPAALLVVEFAGDTRGEVEGALGNLQAHLRRVGRTVTPRRILDPAAQAAVWDVRKAGLGILMSLRGDVKPVPGIEDVAVPVTHLPAYVADMQALLADHGVRGGFYGHASAGCLHVRPLLNLKTAHGVQQLATLTEATLDLALHYGGVTSSEHGDGLARGSLNARLFGPRLYQALCELKSIFDPQNLLNPGKVVHVPSPTENLRYGPDYQTLELRTHLDFSADSGFAGAVEMCNGAGVCRKLGRGTMCPSFQATRNEVDSTRGRANALRAVLSGRLPASELTSPAMADVMDLCLSCKACKSECPSRVDMAKLKTEFLAQMHDVHGVPLRSRLFGHVATGYRLGSVAPALSNALLRSPLSRFVQVRLGIDPQRRLPPLAPVRFSAWFDRRPRPLRVGPLGPVVLFHDTWTEYNHPELGRAAVEVLEAAGYHVLLVRRQRCCGRPMLSKGLVEDARRLARHNVTVLAPYVEQGIPVIGLEPSCILTLRDEYLSLLPHQADAQRLADNSFTIEEFVYRHVQSGVRPLTFRPVTAELLLHGHCHQKALVGVEPARALLQLLPGCTVHEIDAGCCGMAGSFGYEVEHADLSRRIAADRLLPALLAHPDATIVASGVSCREQIAFLTGRRARHWVEVVARGVEGVGSRE